MDQKLFVLLALFFNYMGAVLAQSENCYFCNSEVHGVACHDPINQSLIQTQRCSDFETEPNQSYYSEILDFFKLHNMFSEKADADVRNTTFPNVCFSLTYEFSSRNVTARGCEQRQKNTREGILDVCDYYSGLIPDRISNFNCSICTSDLCNVQRAPGSGSKQVLSFKLIVAIVLAKVALYLKC